MQWSRCVFGTFAIAVTLALTACDDTFLEPCRTKDAAEKLDGIWAIYEINGAPIPAKGYQVTTNDYLKAGSLEFKTRSVVGECKDPDSYSGVVIIRYAIFNAAGQLQPGKTYTGSFDYNRRNERVLFRNSKRWIEGPKSEDIISVEGLEPSTWSQVTIRFTKTGADI
jgi:hypothetical protein